ncbi:hypothetical protein DJ013_11580 [Arcticibacterium luteifluviistationis]|uniref:Lipocalin-like domain-containing protein n=2 Tax=Arcticibacterium luteifluviistationis TaxID=1784714 RepID=A0A2Z4GCG3_9BACT|nr:hypothetical protein DJ013_11580 [Arcticibacterium luteifluviistationis]
MIVAIGCNSNQTSKKETSTAITQEQLDNFEKLLTADGYFWQSKNSRACAVEILFRKDKTATVLAENNQTYIRGNWTFDKSMNKLQIAWEGSDQVFTEVATVNAEGTEISFTKDVYFVCGNNLKRLNLLDKRFEEKVESVE